MTHTQSKGKRLSEFQTGTRAYRGAVRQVPRIPVLHGIYVDDFQGDHPAATDLTLCAHTWPGTLLDKKRCHSLLCCHGYI